MKLLLLTALVASVAADADPSLGLLGTGVYGSGILGLNRGLLGTGLLGSRVVVGPTIVRSPVIASIGHKIWKRDAEPEPEADADAEADASCIGCYGTGLAGPGLLGAGLLGRGIIGRGLIGSRVIAAPALIRSPLIARVGHKIWKRDADAEPEPEADPSRLYGSPYGRRLVAAPLIRRPHLGLSRRPLLGLGRRVGYGIHKRDADASLGLLGNGLLGNGLIGTGLLGSGLLGTTVIGGPVVAPAVSGYSVASVHPTPLIRSSIWKRDADASHIHGLVNVKDVTVPHTPASTYPAPLVVATHGLVGGRVILGGLGHGIIYG